ncbi:MAG: UDP-N-acetylglucosamine pyrophosphorylase [Propionibacteriaceae bacterium]
MQTLPLPRGSQKVMALLDKGVTIPNPWTLDIADEVDINKISAHGVVLHPGTRLRGASTVISAGCVIGAEAPMTLEDCQLGPRVELKGGVATQAVFLAGANLGSGAQIRGGSILEEEASGAHTVGLKQTILFPFVTLGSLINFCDVLMAGGTSRKHHSEVGSSYIHFNFTPDGDKTTASLFGDVPRGVLLNQPPIFLGGQGGAVGPVVTGFDVVVGAGSVLREDLGDGELIVPEVVSGIRRPNARGRYSRLATTLEKNVTYIASLVALDAWYQQVRAPFFAHQEFGELVLAGAHRQLASGIAERSKRLITLVEKVDPADAGQIELRKAGATLLAGITATSPAAPKALIEQLQQRAKAGDDYLSVIRRLDEVHAASATQWLTEVITQVQRSVAQAVPSMKLWCD